MKKYILIEVSFLLLFWIGGSCVGNYWGKTKEVTEINYEKLSKTKYVVVDFYATWCGPCKMQMPIMEKLKANIPDRVAVYKCDIDNDPFNNYCNVSTVPTIIIFKDGKEIDRYVGFTNYFTIKSAI